MTAATRFRRRAACWTAALLVVGAGGGVALALLLFAFPPTVIGTATTQGLVYACDPLEEFWRLPVVIGLLNAAEDDDGPDLSSSFAAAWTDHGGSGPPPRLRLDASHCTGELRVWGTPMLPERRAIWQGALQEALEEALQRLAGDLDRHYDALEAQRRWQSARLGLLLEQAADAEQPPASAPIPRRTRQQTWSTELGDTLEQQHRNRATAAFVEMLRDDLAVELPASPLLTVVLGAVLGAGVAGLVLLSVRLRTPRRR